MITTRTNTTLHINQKTDVQNIAVYEQKENEQVFLDVKFIDYANADIDTKVMEHPKEDGTLIVDHAVNEPNKVSLQILIDDDDSGSFNELLDYHKNLTPLTVKAKNEIFTNMVIASRPLKIDDKHYDSSLYELTFKEIQSAKSQYVKMNVPEVKNKRDASKVKTGQKQTQKQPQKKTSVMAKIKKQAGL